MAVSVHKARRFIAMSRHLWGSLDALAAAQGERVGVILERAVHAYLSALRSGTAVRPDPRDVGSARLEGWRG
jgi:hypothetical protein